MKVCLMTDRERKRGSERMREKERMKGGGDVNSMKEKTSDSLSLYKKKRSRGVLSLVTVHQILETSTPEQLCLEKSCHLKQVVFFIILFCSAYMICILYFKLGYFPKYREM